VYGGGGAARFVPNVSFSGADATYFVHFSCSICFLMKEAKVTAYVVGDL
jgi:hypothetical protein